MKKKVENNSCNEPVTVAITVSKQLKQLYPFATAIDSCNVPETPTITTITVAIIISIDS